jgi:sulfatase modifying factor 1
MTGAKRDPFAHCHLGLQFGCTVAFVAALTGTIGCYGDELSCYETKTCPPEGGAGGEANTAGRAGGTEEAQAQGGDTEVGGGAGTDLADASNAAGSEHVAGGAANSSGAGGADGVVGGTRPRATGGAPGDSPAGGAAGTSAGGVSAGGADGGTTGTTGACEPKDERSCVEAGLYGPCAVGSQVCGTDGKWGECSISPRAKDTCEKGNDANCNGTPNEGCTCTAGFVRPCEDAEGDCAEGVETCLEDGSGWSACSIEPESTDSCESGSDANCNGVPNEGCPCLEGETQPCGPENEIGICRAGLSTCMADGSWGACDGAVNKKSRDCRSHEDNDCDGLPDDTVDDTCKCVVGDTQPCQTHTQDGIGVCKPGLQTCVALQYGSTSDWSACSGSVGPRIRDCSSSRDNDCDGIPDNGTGGPAFVRLPEGYCIDSTEVTRAQYRAWLDSDPSTDGQPGKCSQNGEFEPDGACMVESDVCQTDCENHPQVCVDWCDAYAYCKAVNKRLCGKIGGGPAPYGELDDTAVSQWYNACSAHGANLYPYGNDYIADACNGREFEEGTTVAVASVQSCQAPTGSGYEGVFDLSGNVVEWQDSCDDMNGECWARGGSFWGGIPDSYLKCSGGTWSMGPGHADAFTGFRCCSR